MAASASILGDAIFAVKHTAVSSADKLVRAWIVVPAGLTLILAACLGVDALLRKLDVSFPASVACLVLLFAALLLSEWLLGGQKTRKLVHWIDVPAGWSLRWINLFFTPAFVLLPLSPPIGVSEVFKIIGVFLIGFFVMMAVAAYMTRALQLVLGTSKRAQDHGDSIPLTAPVLPSAFSTPAESRQSTPPPIPQTPPQLRLQDHHHGQVSMTTMTTTTTSAASPPAVSGTTTPVQAPVPPTRAERWCTALTAQLDLAIWVVLLLFVALPVSYVAGYQTPLHLALTVLAYNAANALPPPRWKTYLHPVLTSSLLTVLLIWLVAATQSSSLRSALTAYRTGAKYTALLSLGNAKAPPGAADILSTLLDASIASLALPMYHHRRSLSAHLPTLLVPNISISVASLLAYPPLCVALGISPERSLSFASRSLTLALAQPATENLGGDGNTVAALCIISGILGVLFGQRILALIRIPEDDYVTRGITLGINSSALATAFLLRTDPRAAALSSLSMILFGAVTVLFTSIPSVVSMVRGLVGL